MIYHHISRKSRISIRNTSANEEHELNKTISSLETEALRTSKKHEALKNTRTSEEMEVVKNRRSRRSIELEEENVQNIEPNAAYENDPKKRSLKLSMSDNNEKITKGENDMCFYNSS